MIKPVNIKLPARNTLIAMIILIVIAAISIFWASSHFSSLKYTAPYVESLDDKQTFILRVTAATSGVAAAISLIPMDVGGQIADQLFTISRYFLIILAVIILFKVLVSIVGFAAFSFIVPIACGLAIAYLYTGLRNLGSLALKFAIFGLVLFMSIPTSIKVSNLIYQSHSTLLDSKVQDLEAAQGFIEEGAEAIVDETDSWFVRADEFIQNAAADIRVGDTTVGARMDALIEEIPNELLLELLEDERLSEIVESEANKERKGWIARMFSGNSAEVEDAIDLGAIPDEQLEEVLEFELLSRLVAEHNARENKGWFKRAGEYISGVARNVGEYASNLGAQTAALFKKAETAINDLISTVAVLLIINALIPIGVLWLFVWLFRRIFAIDLTTYLPANVLPPVGSAEPQLPGSTPALSSTRRVASTDHQLPSPAKDEQDGDTDTNK